MWFVWALQRMWTSTQLAQKVMFRMPLPFLDSVNAEFSDQKTTVCVPKFAYFPEKFWNNPLFYLYRIFVSSRLTFALISKFNCLELSIMFCFKPRIKISWFLAKNLTLKEFFLVIYPFFDVVDIIYPRFDIISRWKHGSNFRQKHDPKFWR